MHLPTQSCEEPETFAVSMFVWIFCFVIWCGLLLNWPTDVVSNPEKELYYLWGFKTSLVTVVLRAISLGLMRFALRCYGHHHLQEARKEAPGNDDAAVMAVLKQTVKDGMKNWAIAKRS